MINKLKHLYRNELIKNQVNINQIDKHILNNFLYNHTGHFHPHYNEWNMRRINKVLELFDLDFFKDKKILVLGDGFGFIGGFFAEIGADVISLEGKQFNVNMANLINKDKTYKSVLFNLENDFTNFGKFDMIINWGLIDVISNYENLLKCSSKMSDLILIETIVNPNNDNEFLTRDINISDSGLSSKNKIPSSDFIENFMKEKGFIFKRYDDENLNSIQFIHNYTWKKDKIKEGQRRFWVFRKCN